METDPQPPVPAPAVPLPHVEPKEVLEKILTGLGLEATVEQQSLNQSVLLHITTDEPGRLIGRHGQTLSQLQFLVNRILLRVSAEAPRVQIDCENYRNRQRDDVNEKAKEAGEKVRRWGEPVEIGPYSTAERQAIQEFFKSDREIEAVSEDGDETAAKKLTLRIKETPKP